MAGLDDLLNQIPTQEIAAKLGADEGEVNSAVQQLVPLLVGSLQHNAQDPEHAATIETDAADQEGGRSLRRPPTSRAPEESADQDGGRSVRFARAGCAPEESADQDGGRSVRFARTGRAPEESADQDGGRSAQRTPQNAAPAAPSRQRHKPAS